MSRKIIEVLASKLELLVNSTKNLKNLLPTQAITDVKEKVGVHVNPMTHDHALEILNIDLAAEKAKWEDEMKEAEDEESAFNGLNPK